MDKVTLQEKRKILEQAKVNLKNYFIGIDHIIDDVVDRISAWYIMPTIITRPLIVNLWGLTGVGKTDLIRRLVKELAFADRFMEMQMSSKSVSWEKSIYAKLMNSDLEPSQPGILLLDEIQRFRTVDDEQSEILDYDFQDVWMLLSDGKFAATDGAKESIMEMMCDILYKKSQRDEDDEDNAPAVVRKKTKKGAKPKNAKPVKKKETEKKFGRYYYEARKLKRLLKLDNDITEIMTWDDEVVLKKLEVAFNDPTFYTEIDYSKLLIFISGNLDEAYNMAAKVSEADRDADEVHSRTKKVNIINIKNALLQRFKPEQIARFGNTHIIYPSLSRNAFEKLIEKRITLLEDMVNHQSHGVAVKFDDDVKSLMYKNGVFPTQGVRPLYSTIDDFFNKCMPGIIIKALEDGICNVRVGYDLEKEKVIATFPDGEKIHVTYVGSLDYLRKEQREKKEVICNVSVHEAGHALVYALLFKTAPLQILSNTTNVYTSGYVFTHNIHENYNLSMKASKVGYAGYCAEELVFGKDNVSNGSQSDIAGATIRVAKAIRFLGHGANASYTLNPDQDAECNYNYDYEATNKEIERIVSSHKAEVSKLLADHKDALIEISSVLMKDEKIDPEDFVLIVKKYGIECDTRSTDDYLSMDYVDTFNKFVSENSKTPDDKVIAPLQIKSVPVLHAAEPSTFNKGK